MRSIHEYWADAETMEGLHEKVRLTSARWEEYMTCSFRFQVHSYGNKIKTTEQVKMINDFSYMGFKGRIDLLNPAETFDVMLDYRDKTALRWTYFGRYIASSHRAVVEIFDVKKRKYIGNTTMDAELSLIMANQALAAKGKLVYDPFVGTGSFICTCGHFGASVVGSDIDGRPLRGKRDVSIRSNLEQYGIESCLVDCLNFDIVHNPWRKVEIFDAIVTDPPYGVRAGAKTLGNKNPEKDFKRDAMIDGLPAHLREDYIPATKPYELSEVLDDLLAFASVHLIPMGRLVFWMPTANEEYKDVDVPVHPRFRLLGNSLQDFGKWGRRLITMEKLDSDEPDQRIEGYVDRQTMGHYAFREKFFRGFDR